MDNLNYHICFFEGKKIFFQSSMFSYNYHLLYTLIISSDIFQTNNPLMTKSSRLNFHKILIDNLFNIISIKNLPFLKNTNDKIK